MATHASGGRHRESQSPLVINVSRLGRRPGSMMTLTEAVPSPARMGAELVAIEAGAPLELDLRLESVSEGVLVTGTVSAPTVGECARCLTEITGDVQIDLTELFAYPDSTTDETSESDEIGRVSGDRGRPDTIDLEQPITDTVGLALPFSPLCRPDCVGLCPQCGVPLASAGPDHQHEQIDPRWAKLAKLMPTDEDQAGGGS
ncbi:YceD family protein [Mycolicibacterium mageritense]|uniref:DUF177 domain-containing protein n=1 Tax=Mycolicibacterium mageritense TaxID=53462 RepID=A0AAI8TU26_MYCME|nr:DUF177 domain-containing protein [Mycolicibacterium mageritense]TXI61228.1 MAG: DUF177 domain-containing protein [Mycolicibacterium mageritense]BDY30948.1 hypothetical protein hbim_04899 [Mycolicibacterium mageritense]